MGVCIDGVCHCPDWINFLAIIGGALIYCLIGFLIFLLVKFIKEDIDWGYIVLFIILWPAVIAMAIAYGVIWFIGRIITMIIIGATKDDLRDLEHKMESKITRGDDKIKNYLEYDYQPPKRKAVKSKAKPKRKKK